MSYDPDHLLHVPSAPRSADSSDKPAGGLSGDPANPTLLEEEEEEKVPFSDLVLNIANITPIPGTDGGLNNAALIVNPSGVNCTFRPWINMAYDDRASINVNDIEAAHYNVTEEDVRVGRSVTLTIDRFKFVDQAQNKLQGVVKGVNSGTTREFSILVDSKAPGGLDPDGSTELTNENLARIEFVDPIIESTGIVNSGHITNGVKIRIAKYPVNQAVDQVYHRKEGDVIHVNIGGVVSTHQVTNAEAASNEPVIMTIEHGKWMEMTKGANIALWYVRDRVGNQSFGFSIPRTIQNRTYAGTSLSAGEVHEHEYDADNNEYYIDADAHARDLNYKVRLNGDGWQINDELHVTYFGLTSAGALKHIETYPVLRPDLLRVDIRLPLAFVKQLVGVSLIAYHERVRPGEPENVPSETVIYKVRGTPVDNRYPAPIVEGLVNGTLPNIDPVWIKVPRGRLIKDDRIELSITGKTPSGDDVYASDVLRVTEDDPDYIWFSFRYQLVFKPLEGSAFTAKYVVNRDAENPSQAVTVPVGDIALPLPAPVSPDAPPPEHRFDELVTKGNLRANVEWHSSIALNDEVRILAEGSKTNDSVPTSWLKVDGTWYGDTLPFYIPRTLLLNNRHGTVTLRWEVRTPPSVSVRRSLPLIVKVGVGLQLTECPTLVEADPVSSCRVSLDPLRVWTPFARTTTFRVTYPMDRNDWVTLKIEGKAGVGTPQIPPKRGVPDAGHDYITFAWLSDFIAAYPGESFEVYFEVLRDNDTTESPRLTVQVQRFPAQTLNLLSVPEAVNGVIDPDKANSVQIRAWPFFRAGRAVGINLYSTTDLALRRAIDVTPAEVSAGRTLDRIPTEYFEDFADDTDVRVEGWVSMDGYNCEETAQRFNVGIYRVRRAAGGIVREIDVGNGPTYIAVSRDGKKACVANGRTPSISVIDLENNTARTVNTVGSVINGLALHPSNSNLYFSVEGAGTSHRNPILNISNFTFRYGNWLHGDTRAICLNPGGTRLFIGPLTSTFIYYWSTVTEKHETSASTVQTGSRAIITNPQGTAFYSVSENTQRVDINSKVRTHSAANNGIASALAHSPLFATFERLFVCVPNLGKVDIYNTYNNGLTYVKSLTGLATPRGVAFHPVKPLAYVTEFASNTVRIIDTTTEELVGSIPGFNQPTGLACSEDGRYLFVCNFGNNTVAVVNV
ncbi:YncE family protein [Pseudomonas sp. P9_2]|uniref:YncE family protein n=1 Tax=Pseudomonas sp. P9_2 TaxID=3043447 RepID=UPI002A366633|nr:YncE family protein [Pseudomonas sp. P9_2]WPN52902.1 YncE family protein [Pseudomonas sp. P9_2]